MTFDDILEWARAALRWAHVFAAFLWIGQTYLFNFFEKNLEKGEEAANNVIGNLWMVHGGGYYIVEKQRFPKVMPKILHWFKWEAGITWLSGALLIAVTYYWGGLLVEPEMSYGTGVAAGVGSIVGGWILYDLLMRTPLYKQSLVMAAIGLVVFMGLAWWLPTVLSSRAVYIHIGGMIGTIMAANVWMRIIPTQRKMLALSQAGKEIDPALGRTGPLRSKHNSYLVMPLVFLMISNHYPTISYGHKLSWLIVGVIMLVGWGAAHLIRGR